MGPIKSLKDDDVMFLHADNQAMARHKCTPAQLREGLLLHILYCGRVLVPIDFLLANQAFNDLFLYEGKLSEQSDMYRLVKSGDIIPVVYSPRYGSIKEYAQQSLERGIVLDCTNEQWLQRAELLNEFRFVSPPKEVSRNIYKDIVLKLLSAENLRKEYFGKQSNKGFVKELAERISAIEQPYRSDIYRIAEQAHTKKIETAVKEIADAAYYVILADVFNANPAIPDITALAVISYYHGGGPDVPFIYSPGRERIISTTLPDLSSLSLASVVEELRDHPKRIEWLKTRREKLQQGYLDIADDEVWSRLGQWTEFFLKYVSISGPFQRRRLLAEERQFKIKTDLLKIGSRLLFLAGVVSSVAELAQSGFPLIGVSFLTSSVTAELLIKKVESTLEKARPTYGSVIPVTKTFTVKGERYR